MTHPHNLGALAAWWALEDATLWIAPLIEAAGDPSARTRAPAARDAAAVERAGAMWRAGRSQAIAARTAAGRAGLTDTSKGLGVVPDIAERLSSLVDVERVAGMAKMDLLQLIGEAAAERIDNAPSPVLVMADLRDMPIPDALRDLDPWRAEAAAPGLWRAARAVRSAVNVPPAHEPYLAGPCPSCDTYGLVWEVAAPSPADWTVLCSFGCTCRGEDCGCGLPVRVPHVAHRWEPASISPAVLGAVRSKQVIAEGAAA